MKFFKYFLIFIINFSCKDSGTKLQSDKRGNVVPISISDTQSVIKNHSPAHTIDTINIDESNVKFIKLDLKDSLNKYGFKPWGWYRIIVGVGLLIYFTQFP